MAILQSSLSDSFSSLIVAFASVVTAALIECILRYRRGEPLPLRDGSVISSALVLALLLPNRIHPVYACIGSAFAVLVVKYGFGGLGANWLNPAAGGWIFLRLSWPGVFREALEGSSLSRLAESLGRGFSNPQGSPLGLLKIDAAGGQALMSGFDTAARSFLNNTVFSLSGAELPGGYMDLLSSPAPGIIADRGLLAFLLGTIVITAARTNRSWIPALYLGIYGIMVRLFGALPYGGGMGNGDLLFGLFSGGTMAGAFILAADPATGAKSNGGIAFAALLGGLLAYLFRYPGGEPYGVIFALVLVNALLPLVRSFEYHALYRRTAPAGGGGKTPGRAP
jgi:electron transport complex protein RnfD